MVSSAGIALIAELLAFSPHPWLAGASCWKWEVLLQCPPARGSHLWGFTAGSSLLFWSFEIHVCLFYFNLLSWLFWWNNCCILKISLFLRNTGPQNICSNLLQVETQHYYLKTLLGRIGQKQPTHQKTKQNKTNNFGWGGAKILLPVTMWLTGYF